jgi:hypothetical protein
MSAGPPGEEQPRTSGVPGDPTGSDPSEEELRAAIEEQLRKLRVEDVVLQSLATLMSLAGRRLGLAPGSEDERDLGQARLAIDAARALSGLVADADAAAIREALSQLQLAYARVAGEPDGAKKAEGAPEGDEGAAGEGTGTAEQGQTAAEPKRDDPGPGASSEAERARARAKIWTPPGT